MTNKIDLAMLNKNDKEMNEKEMKEVKGGLPKCECKLPCEDNTGLNVMLMNRFNTLYDKENTPMDDGKICSCAANFWTFYGHQFG